MTHGVIIPKDQLTFSTFADLSQDKGSVISGTELEDGSILLFASDSGKTPTGGPITEWQQTQAKQMLFDAIERSFGGDVAAAVFSDGGAASNLFNSEKLLTSDEIDRLKGEALKVVYDLDVKSKASNQSDQTTTTIHGASNNKQVTEPEITNEEINLADNDAETESATPIRDQLKKLFEAVKAYLSNKFTTNDEMAFDKDILVDLEMFSEEQIEKIIEEAGDRAINKMDIEDEIPSPEEMAPFMNEAMREVVSEAKKDLLESFEDEGSNDKIEMPDQQNITKTQGDDNLDQDVINNAEAYDPELDQDKVQNAEPDDTGDDHILKHKNQDSGEASNSIKSTDSNSGGTNVRENENDSSAQKTNATSEVKPKSESDKGRELLDNFISEINGENPSKFEALFLNSLISAFDGDGTKAKYAASGFDKELARNDLVLGFENLRSKAGDGNFAKLTTEKLEALALSRLSKFIDSSMKLENAEHENEVENKAKPSKNLAAETKDLEDLSKLINDRKINNRMLGQLFVDRMDRKSEIGGILKEARDPNNKDKLGDRKGFPNDQQFENNESAVTRSGALKHIVKAFENHPEFVATMSSNEKRAFMVDAMKDYLAFPEVAKG